MPGSARTPSETAGWQPLKPVFPGGIRIRVAGGLFLLVTALLGVASLTSESNLLFLMFCLCVSGIAFSVYSTWRAARNLAIRRLVPDKVVVGQPFPVRYELRRGRRLGGDFALEVRERLKRGRLRVAAGFVPVISGRQTVAVEVPALALARGRLILDQIRVSTSFPFGLFNKVMHAAAARGMVAYPALGRLRQEVLPEAATHEMGSAQTSLFRRNPDELYGLREYRHGDNPQWIHWRRSARTGDLVIREMVSPRGRELLVVLDHRRDADRQQFLEDLVSCAATLACRAIDREMRVGLLGLSEEVAAVAPAAGKRQRDRLLLELATLSGQPGGSPADLIDRWPWSPSREASAILLTCFDDAASDALLGRLRRRVGSVRMLVAGGEQFKAAFEPPHPPPRWASGERNG